SLRFFTGPDSGRRCGPRVDCQTAPVVDECHLALHPAHWPVQFNLRLHDLFIILFFFHCWDNATLFQTGWFVESLLTQTLIIHVIRTNRIPFLQSWASWPLIVTTGIIMAFGAWLP